MKIMEMDEIAQSNLHHHLIIFLIKKIEKVMTRIPKIETEIKKDNKKQMRLFRFNTY